MTDSTLFEKWLTERDAEAFRQIATRYSAMVYATCVRMLGNRTEAEDVAQECFEALAKTNRPAGSYLGAWLHRVAANRCLDRIKAEGRRRVREARYGADRNANREESWDEVYEFVDEAIAELPDKLRVPLVAHFLENQTHEAIAQTLKVPRQTVTYRISKGVERVRVALKRKGVEIAAVSLAGMLAANTSEAAPAGLVAGVGKLALAGPKVAAPFALALAAKVAVGVAGILVIIGAGFGAWHFRPAAQSAAPVGAETSVTATPASVAAAPTSNLGTKTAEESKNVGTGSGRGGKKDETVQGSTSGSGSIQGFAWDENCQPVAGARVTVALSATDSDMTARRVHEPFQETMTDEAGQYEFRDLSVDARLVLCATTEEMFAIDSCRLKWARRVENFRLLLQPKNHIRGLVIDSAGNPVAGAVVLAFKEFADGDVHVGTDLEGRFELAQVGSGKWRARVWADGYAPATSDWIASGAAEARIALTQGGSVSGVVVGAGTGAPVPNLSIRFGNKAVRESVNTTDGSGQFRVATLEPGEYWVRVEDPEYVVPSKESRERAPISIKEGEETRDVRVTVARAATVAGRIYDKDSGVGVSGVRVFAERIESGGLQAGQGFSEETGASGEYRIGGLPAGLYSLIASGGKGFRQKSWGVAQAEARTMEIELGKPYEGVDFAFWKGIVVRGKVVGPDGKPVSNVCVRARTVGERANDQFSTDGFSNEDGTFELPGFETASSKLYIQAGGANHLDWNAAPHDELICEAQGPLELPREGLSGLILTVRPGAGMTGRVLDAQGAPVNDVFVSAESMQNRGADVSSNPFSGNGSITDTLGRYRLAGLLPAAYEIHLSKRSGRDSEAYTADFITLGEGERVERHNLVWGVNKTQDTGLTIAGRVTDAQGQALRGVQVMAFSDVGSKNRYVVTDASGSYRIGGLGEGTYQVSASRNGLMGEAQTEIAAGSTDVNFALRAAPTIVGHVLGAATGKPVAGAEISQVSGRDAIANGQELYVEAQSDAQGRFSVSAQDSDTISVMAKAEGFATGAAVVEGVRSGAFDTDVVIRLQAAKRVTGVVRDSSGKAIADAKLFVGRTPQGFERVKPLAVSDREGGFVLTKLNPGRQTIIAQHTNFAPNSVVADASSDAPVEIVLSKGATLKGRVTYEGPRVPTRIRVFYFERPELSPALESVKDDGAYSIAPLAAGRVSVSTESANDGRSDVSRSQWLVLEDGKESTADFAFAGGTSVLEGRVLVGGQPAKGSVHGKMDTPGGTLNFGAQLGPDGEYRVEKLEAGAVAVTVRIVASETTGLLKSESVVLTEENTTRQDFAFEGRAVLSGVVRGATREEIVSVGIAPGDVSARIASGKLTLPLPYDVVADTEADAQGAFRIESLDAGQYTVIVRATPRSGAGPRDRVRQAAAVVTVVDGREQSATVDLPKPPAG